TIAPALEAERAGAAWLLRAQRPVLSVNGNVAALCTGGGPTREIDPCADRGEPVPSVGSSGQANQTSARAGGSRERLGGEAQCPDSRPRIEAGSVASRGCVRGGCRARPP